MPAPARPIARYAPPRPRSSTIRSGSSGFLERIWISTNATSSTAEAASMTTVSGSPQLVVSACEKP